MQLCHFKTIIRSEAKGKNGPGSRLIKAAIRKDRPPSAALPSTSSPPNTAARPLDSQLLNHELVLSWTNGGFSLQTAPASTGTFTNLPSATSSYTNTITATQEFFRLKKN